MFCNNCGKNLNGDENFCPNCGSSIHKEKDEIELEQKNGDSFDNLNKNQTKHVTTLRLFDLFVNIFKKHKKSELEDTFVAGTHYNTLPLCEVSSNWPKPWLYSRVFFALLLVFAVLSVCAIFFYNYYSLAGMMFIGAMVVPFSLLIFYFESNSPRNISIFTVVKVFFIGGVFSLLAALILYTFINVTELNVGGAILVGIVEEVAKLIVVYAVVKRLKCKYILNGLLIGAAVGAGFAVFETAGYALNSLLESGEGLSVLDMIATLWVRSLLAIGGHISWAAISGGALVWAAEKRKISFSIIFTKRFFFLFLLSIVLHALWDMPFWSTIIPYIVLCIIAVILTLRMMSLGLKQITMLQEEECNGCNDFDDDEQKYDKKDVFLG